MTAGSKGSKVAVIGGGVAGLTAAWLMAENHDVTLYEKNHYIGGHTHTLVIPDGPDQGTPVDTGFIVYNDQNYPHFIKLLQALDVQGVPSDMSFGFRHEGRGLEYSSYFPQGLFAQKRNLFRPSFLWMIKDILRFNRTASRDLERDTFENVTLGEYLKRQKFGKAFREHYLVPMGAAIWSTPPDKMDLFPMKMFARFFHNHGLLALKGRPSWKTIPGGSHTYVKKILERLEDRAHIDNPVRTLWRNEDKVHILNEKGETKIYDFAVVATHADEALALLRNPSADEQRLLGAWQYNPNRAVLHTDESFMPVNRKAWASWNYSMEESASSGQTVTLTYHMNCLQPLNAKRNYFVTLNPLRDIDPKHVIKEMDYTHPLYTFESIRTQTELKKLNGESRIFFCGSYFRYGFHEDAVMSALSVAEYFGAGL